MMTRPSVIGRPAIWPLPTERPDAAGWRALDRLRGALQSPHDAARLRRPATAPLILATLGEFTGERPSLGIVPRMESRSTWPQPTAQLARAHRPACGQEASGNLPPPPPTVHWRSSTGQREFCARLAPAPHGHRPAVVAVVAVIFHFSLFPSLSRAPALRRLLEG